MPADEPSWWYATAPTTTQALIPTLLQPAAWAWGYASARRIRTAQPYRASVPVICIGNFTAGGTGKTPLSIHIAGLLIAAGESPVFLTRGYRGRHKAPHLVDLTHDTATDVGDEPLLLAQVAPTLVARDRAQGAAAMAGLVAERGLAAPTVIIMDDGLQNPGLAKDLTIAVVDGRRGLGNGCVIPAGPLRAPLAAQLALADAILINGSQRINPHPWASSYQGPVISATVAPAPESSTLRGVRVLALAGIGNPTRFSDLLTDLGATVVDRQFFPDHHTFTEADATRVLAKATELDARIVTTQKDRVRLTGATGRLGALRDTARAVPIHLVLADGEHGRLTDLVTSALTRRRRDQP